MNRHGLKPDTWHPVVKKPKPAPEDQAWWVRAAQPGQFNDFTVIAAQRAKQGGWTNLEPHARNVTP